VSDVSDDVRRGAVLNLGFVLCATPEQCPRVVALLAESYNPHVRYGAAMAVGIACAATGNKEAAALLEPLAADPVDFVRQGAYIATALLLLQQPEARVAPFRRVLERAVGDKHEEALAKMGAIIATGILDAGGRNATLALRSHSGGFRMSAFIGLALFAQQWYWFPLGALLSVALSPSALIALNGDLAMPKFEATSAARASTFAYAPPASAVAAAPTAKAVTAVLSTTARAKAKASPTAVVAVAEACRTARGMKDWAHQPSIRS
jgi:26S proteasome regulatory subunit N2